ncbi:aldolase/citrate lyase family protein [Azohydromonas australica]|uniref:aldolase/citrate lyase family protein n=1 Tax=Azohydromonas australica TaxID=364039 RepID=UPI000411F3AC|nr:HpcH/HpaI aldolase/citrate lyase family protein [Azohydromonas australica]
MKLPPNEFKRALKSGRAQVGFWLSLGNAYSAEVVAGAGYDWLLLDGEHSPIGTETTLAMLQAVAAYPVSAVVRPASNDTVLIKRALDIGAQTLLVPYVETPEEAAQAVAAMRYPPRGRRGVGGGTVRATRFGRIADYATACENELCLLVQAETRRSLDNLEAIASVDGVDGVFIGPADLATDMGYPGQASHPQVVAAIEDAIGRINACGKASGILTLDAAFAKRCQEWGALFTAIGVDVVLLARGCERQLASFKSDTAEPRAPASY